MGTDKPTRDAAVVALEDFYVQAVLDASGDELRAEAIAMGEDPEVMIAEATAAFQATLARCAISTETWPDAEDPIGAPLHARDAVSASVPGGHVAATEPLDPFATLDARSLRAAAASFGCNTNFFGRLKDRLIRIEDLTDGFVAALAGALEVSPAALVRFLEGPARVPLAARFKSDGKPTAADKQSLAEALEASGMTDEQKHRLGAL